MKAKIALLIFLFVVVPITTSAYVTINDHTWTTDELVTAAKLELYIDDNLSALDDGLDSLAAALRDSIKTVVGDSGFAYKATLRDSVQAVIDDSTFAYQLYDVSTYLVDSTDPPATFTVQGRTAAAFSPDSTQIIYFTVPMDGFTNLASDKNLHLFYAMSTADAAGRVVMAVDYTVYKIGSTMSSTTTRADTVTIDPDDGALTFAENSDLTFTASDFDAPTNKLEVRLERIHDAANDDHIGLFYMFDMIVK